MASVAEWRTAPGLPHYEVSSEGSARRVGKQERKLKFCPRGYAWLSVADGRGSSRNVSVARLVCEAFNGPPPAPAMDCDHINRKRADNRPENLRWLTRAENLANRQNAAGENHSSAKLSEATVRMIRAMGFVRGQDARLAVQLGVSRETVRDVRLLKVWGHVDA
jgi:hypothetical protein